MSQWDERYNTDSYFYGTEPNDFLKESVKALPIKGQVLCLAEGEGRNAVYLAEQGFDVTAMDGSPVGLEKLKSLASKKNVQVKTIVSDLADFEIEANKWDAIVSIWCHIPSSLRAKIHGDVIKGLKQNGVFVLEAYHPRQLNYKTGGPPTTDLLMTVDALKSELSGLKFEVLHDIDREIHEGVGHNGKSAVVQALARKVNRL